MAGPRARNRRTSTPRSHGARAVGDEPLLLARVAPCFVGADRVAAARQAIAAGASALVLDDGLQNPSLAKDFTFAVIDGEARFGNGLCFPAGPLRAPPAAANAVRLGRGRRSAARPTRWPRCARWRRESRSFARALEADAIVGAELVGRPVLAFAGIARPEKFFATLEALGARVAAQAPLSPITTPTTRAKSKR